MSESQQTTISTRPRLLVSIRSAAEAQAALAGGCDILDVKEPARGSLGMADPVTIADVLARAHDLSVSPSLRPSVSPSLGASASPSRQPISAALGEVSDWTTAGTALPAGLKYVKLGLSGLGGSSDWQSVWLRTRERIERLSADSSWRWIAVAYADWQRADAPPPETVIDAAATTGCAGVLFDTWLKDGRTLLDFLAGETLIGLADRTRRHGLLLAVAGGLRREMLPSLLEIRPDIIAIRTAACRQGERHGPVCADAVAAFKAVLISTHP